jgi:hypothetical protein
MSSRFNLNPRKLFVRTRFNYEKVPGDSQTSSPLFGTPLIKSWKHRNPMWANRLQRPRLSFARIIMLMITSLLIASMIGTGVYRRHSWNDTQGKGEERKQYHWEHYPR